MKYSKILNIYIIIINVYAVALCRVANVCFSARFTLLKNKVINMLQSSIMNLLLLSHTWFVVAASAFQFNANHHCKAASQLLQSSLPTAKHLYPCYKLSPTMVVHSGFAILKAITIRLQIGHRCLRPRRYWYWRNLGWQDIGTTKHDFFVLWGTAYSWKCCKAFSFLG